MSEVAIDPYKGYIKEAFIDPIKSVLIIDDDYPTRDEQLFIQQYQSSTEPEHQTTKQKYQEKDWRNNPKKYENIILKFRENSWLVDTHDGHGMSFREDERLTKHLHQSDLLILDYQLEGEALGGDKCISALQQLASNKHFNLVVVHTKKDTSEVFFEILTSLLAPSIEIEKGITAERMSEVDESIEEWEDEDAEIISNLVSSIGLQSYLLAHRNLNSAKGEVMKGPGGQFGVFNKLIESMPDGIKLRKVDLFLWTLIKKQEQLKPRFLSPENSNNTKWSTGDNGENWIRTERLFVTIASKQETDNLPDILLNALHAWNPLPPRLILTKLRSRLENMGVSYEDQFLSNLPLQAGWYYNLLTCSEHELNTQTSATISTYWDGISTNLQTEVAQYAQNIVKFDIQAEAETEAKIEERFQYTISNDEKKQLSLLHHNAYSCSKEPTGWHLTTGHVLDINGERWICLSPACDLVPHQKKWPKLNGCRPFKGVKLHKRSGIKEALEEANSNTYVFLNIADNVEIFSLILKNDAAALPQWEEMFTEDSSPISITQDGMSIQVSRLEWNDESNSLQTVRHHAKIISQLRYEYALNLLQRLGSSLSRIGLDFRALRSDA